MIDGSGTTQWSYLPVGVLGAGQVFNETTAYGTTTNSYDALGRPITRKVGNAEEKWTYDELGRIKRHQNPLGAFDYGYLGRTGQVASEQLAGGAFGTSYRYQGNDQDRRLKAITPTAARTLQSGGSAFFYRFDVNGQLTAQTRILGPDWAWSERYSLDGADRLTGYQIDLRLNGGLIDPMALAVILAEQPDPVGWLDPIAPIYQGTGTFSMTTSDSVIGATSPPGSLAASWSGQVDNRNQLTRVNATAIHSDANGNITDDGERIYYWDAEQRLFGILNKNTNRGTVFIYDGLGRRVREYDADLTRGTLDLAQKADYAWCGSKVCQTRDAWGTTIEMPQGLIRQGSPIAYYFHRDHLGSVVDVSQADGGHLARTMYSPYGQKELLSSDAAYVEYAGMRFHEPSGLYLTYYRAYDPKLGRWLSKDPIGEAGGLNLYGYVGCRPGSYTDPWGLFAPPVQEPVAPPTTSPSVPKLASPGPTTASASRALGFCGRLLGVVGLALYPSPLAGPCEDEVNNPQCPGYVNNPQPVVNQKGKHYYSNNKNPNDAAEDLGRKQAEHKKNRPSTQAGSNGDNDWEGCKKRPEQCKIQSTDKTDQRADHRNKSEYRSSR